MAGLPDAQLAVVGLQGEQEQDNELLQEAEGGAAAFAQQGDIPVEPAAPAGGPGAEQQQGPPLAVQDQQEQQQHQQQLEQEDAQPQAPHVQQLQAQHQPGAAAAGAGAPPAVGGEPPPEGPSHPDFSYAPEEECDLVLRTSDGKRIGVHRLIVLRTCGVFKELLAACAGEAELAVTERYDEVRPLLLDVLYDRSVAIHPQTALQMFHLADKYEAPSLMQACRAVFLSGAFELGISSGAAGGQQDASEGHASWTDMLSLASKHEYGDLAKRCIVFFMRQCQERPSQAIESLVRERALLLGLARPHLESLLVALGKSALARGTRAKQDLKAVQEQLEASRAEVEALKKRLEAKHSSYMKLLGKHNRLLDKCDKHQVTWHKDLEAPQKKKRKS